MKIGRREFLEGVVVGLGGIVAGCAGRGPEAAARKAPRSANFDPYETVSLGKTKIKLSRVGMGTGMRGSRRQSNQTRLGKEKFEALLHRAYDRGVRWFDLADMYGSHPYVAAAFRGMRRRDYTIITKIWWRRGGLPERERPRADVVVERFLKELKTDYLDVVLLHCVTSSSWPERLAGHMEALDKLKRKGAIRAHGVSCHSLGALEAAAGESWVDTVHARINPYGAVMDGPPSSVAPVLQKIHEAGKGVVGMKMIGEGRFRHSDEMRDRTLRYVLGLGCVDTLVVGFERPWEIDDFAARVRKVPRSVAVKQG